MDGKWTTRRGKNIENENRKKNIIGKSFSTAYLRFNLNRIVWFGHTNFIRKYIGIEFQFTNESNNEISNW